MAGLFSRAAYGCHALELMLMLISVMAIFNSFPSPMYYHVTSLEIDNFGLVSTFYEKIKYTFYFLLFLLQICSVDTIVELKEI